MQSRYGELYLPTPLLFFLTNRRKLVSQLGMFVQAFLPLDSQSCNSPAIPSSALARLLLMPTSRRKKMKKQGHVAVLFMVSLLFLGGCATYIKPHSSPDALASIGNNKIAQKADIVISDKDLALEHSVHFGLVGFLFPVNVKVGEALKTHSEEYFSKIFSNEVTFRNQSADSISVVFEIKDFNISAVGTAAHLELKMAVNDKNKKQILEKIYIADGKGYPPLYFGSGDQELQVKNTTEEAFQKVFNEISKDIQKIAFR